MKSYQKRPKRDDEAHRRPQAAAGWRGLGGAATEREHERPRHREPGDEHDDDRQLAAGPLEALAARREHAQALDRPERPERRQQDPDAVLDRVLRHARQRPMEDRADRQHDRPGDRGTRRRERHVARRQPERQDDEHDLEALEQHALERDDEREPVEAHDRLGAGAARPPRPPSRKIASSSCSAFSPAERRIGLAQPLQPEDQQQRPDDELEQRLREPLDERVAGDDRDEGEDDERGRGPGERRAPVAGDAHREHDRERLDELDRGGEP